MGHGYGETACVHLGGHRWLIVDSMCRRPGAPPAALEYLQGLYGGQGPDVRAIVATHWHDDHTVGIGDLLAAFPTAIFSVSGALDAGQFLTRVRAVTKSGQDAPEGMRGLYGALSSPPQLDALPGELVYAWSRRLIDDRPAVDVLPGYSVWALSPSDRTQDATRAGFSDWLWETVKAGAPAGVPHDDQNDLAVAVHVQVGTAHVLLGSDLVIAEAGHGWVGVLADLTGYYSPASLYKIAHHGSRTAHAAELFGQHQRLLAPHAIGLLAPYRNGSSNIPSRKELDFLRGKLDEVWTTSPDPRTDVSVPTPARVGSLLAAHGREYKTLTRDFGLLRARRPSDAGNHKWHVVAFDAARVLTS